MMPEMNLLTLAVILLTVLVVSVVLAMWTFSAAYGWFWGAMSAKDRFLRNKLQKLDYQKFVDDDESGFQDPTE